MGAWTRAGNAAESNSSRTHGKLRGGQLPAFLSSFSMSSPAETASPTSNGGIGASTAQGDDEKPRDTTRDPTDATTITGSANPDASTPAPSTKFEPNTPSKASKEQEPTVLNSSFDAHTPPSSKKPSPRKKSIWSSLLAKLVPCLSSKAHTIVIDDARPPRDSLSTDSAHAKVPSELQPTAQKDSISQAVISEKLAPSTPTRSSSAPPLDTDLPLPLPITEVVVPPSPKTHLLPPSETAGVTSGAVQAPGSTGREEEEDSQGASSDEEDGEHNGTSGEGTVPDDDDEDRLILQGGIGIPIVVRDSITLSGSPPVSNFLDTFPFQDGVPRPLLPPVAPEHRGRKCLVLDLDETLLHSSFKVCFFELVSYRNFLPRVFGQLIPQCDYVVPVEIEWQWHNVYVIKRPGVDAFLKKMGELFEIVVFTASLSKVSNIDSAG